MKPPVLTTNETFRRTASSNAFFRLLVLAQNGSRNIMGRVIYCVTCRTRYAPRAEKPKAAQRYTYFWEIRRATRHKNMDKKDTQNKIRCPSRKNPLPQRQEIDLIFRRLTEREEEAWKNALFFVSLQSLLPLE